MGMIKRAARWYWRRGQVVWIVWMTGMLVINAPGWVDHWWYVPGVLFYVGIIIINAYNWGRARSNEVWTKIATDQLDLLKKQSAELDDYAKNTVSLPVMVLPNLDPDQPRQQIHIVHGVSLN